MGLAGSIINVPVQMDIVQKSLPQSINNTITIAIALKRRLEYKNAYQTGKVCVHTIMRALKELCSQNLYKIKIISINSNWNHILELDNRDNKFEDDNIDSKSETDSISETEKPTETLVLDS